MISTVYRYMAVPVIGTVYRYMAVPVIDQYSVQVHGKHPHI